MLNNETINEKLKSLNPASDGGNLIVNGDVEPSGDLFVGGAASITGSLSVGGKTTLYEADVLGLEYDPGAGAPVNTKVFVTNIGGEIITTIFCDLTGAGSKNDDGDIIGIPATDGAYLTRVTDAINGIIHKVEMTCTELPTATANPGLDFDLITSTAADGAYDDDATGMAGYAAIITGGGDMAKNLTKEASLGTVPAANAYLYLATGATHTGDSVYTGGQLVIQMRGYATI